MKSEGIANLLKKSGNELYLKSRYSEALIEYNKALCHAESDELKSLLYANRSAIYFKVKRYKMCLENIQLAIQHGYPQDKLVKLQEREEQCKEHLSAGDDVLEDDQKVEEFFKLSYEAHPKIPFIIDRIELKNSKKYGNHLITNRDLKAGDIIAIEPFLTRIDSFFSEYCYEKCAVCLRHNFYSLIPCEKCSDNLFIDMFCSESCKAHHNAIYHENFCPEVKLVGSKIDRFERRLEASKRVILTALKELGSKEELFKLAKNPAKLTIFDVDELSHQNILKIFFSMAQLEVRKKGISQSYELDSASMLPTQKDFKELFIQVYATFSTNALLLERFVHDGVSTQFVFQRFGESVGVFGSLFNHSCDPNIARVSLDNRMIFYVSRPIKAGEQLFVSYAASYGGQDLNRRREDNLNTFDFICDCDACVNDYPLIHNLRKLDEVQPVKLDISTIESAIETLKENFELVNKLQHEHPCYETANLIGCNNMVMSYIAKVGL